MLMLRKCNFRDKKRSTRCFSDLMVTRQTKYYIACGGHAISSTGAKSNRMADLSDYVWELGHTNYLIWWWIGNYLGIVSQEQKQIPLKKTREPRNFIVGIDFGLVREQCNCGDDENNIRYKHLIRRWKAFV